jgi:hypothetical protein
VTPRESAARLRAAVDEGMRIFGGASEEATAGRPAPGRWCAREVLGHLIDSACNNHRRFVLAHSPSTARWDGYEQDLWVSSQRYADQPWDELVALWHSYNRHLARVMEATPDAIAVREASAPDGSRQLSLTFLIDDYVRHLDHHLGQIKVLLER